MNTNEDKKYNGWTNWDTWNLNLWLNNEQDTQNYFMNIRCFEQFEESARQYVKALNGMKGENIDSDKVNYLEIFESFNED